MIRIDSDTSVKEFFEAVDNFLANAENEKQYAIWSIFSALRGPDAEGRIQRKHETTAHIRGKVFPLFMRAVHNNFTYSENPNIATIEIKYSDYSHFENHIDIAVKAIKHNWGE